MGEHDLEADEDCEGEPGLGYCSDQPIDVKVEERINHNLYNPESETNVYGDIALLRLKNEIPFTSNEKYMQAQKNFWKLLMFQISLNQSVCLSLQN